MAPTLQKIRQVASKKRKAAVGDHSPGPTRRVVIKIAKGSDTGAPSGVVTGRAEAATTPPRGEARDAEAGVSFGKDEAEKVVTSPTGDEGRLRSSSPGVPSPIDLTETPPRQGVGSPPPSTVPDEPTLAAESVPEAPTNGNTRPEVGPSVAEPSGSMPNEAGGEEAETPTFQSLLQHHSRWVEKTMAQVAVPELRRFLQHQGTSAFFREASVAHFWAFNSLAATRDLMSQAETTISQLQEEMSQVQSRANEAEGAIAAARAEVARAERAEAEAEAARFRNLARAEQAEAALEVAQRQAANELDNAQVAEEKQRAAEEKQRAAEVSLKAAESEVFRLRHHLQSANIEIGVAEERAENAEEIARNADAEISFLKAEVTEAKRKATEAEAKSVRAVEDFRKSEAFDQELAETTAFAYDGGFKDCKEKVKRLYNIEGIEELEPDEIPEDDGSAPTEP